MAWDKTEHKDDSLCSSSFHWNQEPMNIAAQPANRYAVSGVPATRQSRVTKANDLLAVVKAHR